MAGGIAVAVAVLCAAFAAWGGARVLVKISNGRARALDISGGDLRKVHLNPTPRVGGIAVAAGILGGVVAEGLLGGQSGAVWLLLLCVAPGLIWGLIEDLSKRGDVTVRLALCAVAAGLGFVLLDARISLIELPVLDDLVAVYAISFAFTVFAVTGVANAFNVIDGLNGLSGISALLGSIGLALIAWTVGDSFVFSAACIVAASVAGFLLVNYPSGRIFLGDGGAYLIGLLLAELSVVLVHRNSEVSVWFPLVLLGYPIWETMFSMYRRKTRGQSTGRADALHLHSLVYRRVVRWKGPQGDAADYVVRNALASLSLWGLPVLCFALALGFWQDTLALQLSAGGFAVFYTLLYRRIVRFGIPPWLVVRAKGRQAPGNELLLRSEGSTKIGSGL